MIRETLYALDETIRGISVDLPGDPRTLKLTNVYHNLVRHHAEPLGLAASRFVSGVREG